MILGSTYRRPHLLSSPRITIVNDRYDVSSIHRQITLGGTPGDWVSKQRINWPGWESGVHFCGPLRWIYNVWPTLLYLSLIVTRQSRGVHPMLVQCWYDVYDVGPPLNQHWMNASCLPGCTQVCQTVLDPLRLSRVDYGCSNRVSACNPPVIGAVMPTTNQDVGSLPGQRMQTLARQWTSTSRSCLLFDHMTESHTTRHIYSVGLLLALDLVEGAIPQCETKTLYLLTLQVYTAFLLCRAVLVFRWVDPSVCLSSVFLYLLSYLVQVERSEGDDPYLCSIKMVPIIFEDIKKVTLSKLIAVFAHWCILKPVCEET